MPRYKVQVEDPHGWSTLAEFSYPGAAYRDKAKRKAMLPNLRFRIVEVDD